MSDRHSTDLIDIAEGITPVQLSQLRLLETWRIKKIKGRWVVCGQARANQQALGWLQFKMLVRADYKPAIPELQLTGLGRDLFALKSRSPKSAAKPHQDSGQQEHAA